MKEESEKKEVYHYTILSRKIPYEGLIIAII